MALKVYNTKDLLQAQNLKLKMLIYSPSGFGKTTFCATAPNPIIAACETGLGSGLASVLEKHIPYVVPETYADLELFASGVGLEQYETLIIDGFSYFTDSIIKDQALTIPRSQGDSKKRGMGVPELSDYGTMAELERRVMARLLQNDKNVICTTLMDYYQPAQGGADPRPEKIGGPDLPGSMRLGSAAMFDVVMRMQTRGMLRNAKDPKSHYYQRYFQTEADGKYLAKSRFRNGNKPLFPNEVVFDMETGEGSFEWFAAKAREAYKLQIAEAA